MSPIGYSNCLYYVVENSAVQLFLSPNDKVASDERPGSMPLDLNMIIPLHGHAKVHSILKNFGDRWIARSGKVYFPPISKGNEALEKTA